MNSRLMLLFVVTAAFVGIWTQDARHQHRGTNGFQRPLAGTISSREPVAARTSESRTRTVSETVTVTEDKPSVTSGVDRPAAASGPADRPAVNVVFDLLAASLRAGAVAATLGTAGGDPAAAMESECGAAEHPMQRAGAPVAATPRSKPDDQPRDLLPAHLPLPEGIVPGCYRVVSSRDGASFVIRISDCDLAYEGIEYSYPAHDLYVAQTASRRWFYIRIDEVGYGDVLLARELAPLPVAQDGALSQCWQPRLDAWRIGLQRGVNEFSQLRSRVLRQLRAIPAAVRQRTSRGMAEWWSRLWNDASPTRLSAQPDSDKPTL